MATNIRTCHTRAHRHSGSMAAPGCHVSCWAVGCRQKEMHAPQRPRRKRRCEAPIDALMLSPALAIGEATSASAYTAEPGMEGSNTALRTCFHISSPVASVNIAHNPRRWGRQKTTGRNRPRPHAPPAPGIESATARETTTCASGVPHHPFSYMHVDDGELEWMHHTSGR